MSRVNVSYFLIFSNPNDFNLQITIETGKKDLIFKKNQTGLDLYINLTGSDLCDKIFIQNSTKFQIFALKKNYLIQINCLKIIK